MKKIIAMLLALVMLLSLAACASSGKTDAPAAADTAAPAETTDTTDTAPAADTKTDGKTYKVAMICDSSINDGGWGAACYNAMVAAAEKKGWQTEVTDSISQDSYYDSIVAYCALGYDMIYAPGNQYTDAVLQAAEEYPDVAFALLNGAVDTPEKAVNKNVSSLLPNAQQIGWIAGALAGLMTETGKLGSSAAWSSTPPRARSRALKKPRSTSPSRKARPSSCSTCRTPTPSPTPRRARNLPPS